MVGNGKDAVKAIEWWELNNKVHSNGFEGKGGMVSGDGAVRCAGASGDGLVGGTTMDEGGDKIFHVRPPVVICKEKASFQDARVSRSGEIMV